MIFNQNLVEITKKYVKKGSKIYIEGESETRKWTDDKGIERYTTEVILNGFTSSLILLDKSESSGGVPPHDGSNQPNYNQQGEPENQEQDIDDDIPFDNF